MLTENSKGIEFDIGGGVLILLLCALFGGFLLTGIWIDRAYPAPCAQVEPTDAD